jgi:MFS family permease
MIIFLIPQALAQNFATLIVTRIITGGCSGVLANITSSIVSDIWRGGRSKSFGSSVWIFGLLAGLSMGPVIGSATLKYISWRWYVCPPALCSCSCSDLHLAGSSYLKSSSTLAWLLCSFLHYRKFAQTSFLPVVQSIFDQRPVRKYMLKRKKHIPL